MRQTVGCGSESVKLYSEGSNPSWRTLARFVLLEVVSSFPQKLVVEVEKATAESALVRHHLKHAMGF